MDKNDFLVTNIDNVSKFVSSNLKFADQQKSKELLEEVVKQVKLIKNLITICLAY